MTKVKGTFTNVYVMLGDWSESFSKMTKLKGTFTNVNMMLGYWS